MKLLDFLTRTFTWWNGTTWGTWLYTRRKGQLVGTDEFGNTYYRALGPVIDPSIGPERRWVIYSGEAEPSRIPPGWRGWLTYTHHLPPTEDKYTPHPWEKPYVPNMTGTPYAYFPQGSTHAEGRRPPATGDYVAWFPDGAAPSGREPEGVSPDGRDVPAPEAHPGTHGHAIGPRHSG